MVHDLGVELAFDMGGNTVAVLEVHDPEADTPSRGMSLTVCDTDGATVFGWHVSVDGEVEFRGPTS